MLACLFKAEGWAVILKFNLSLISYPVTQGLLNEL